MKAKTVRMSSDAMPPLSAEQRAHLEQLAALPDEMVDTSDIPELTDDQLRTAVRGKFYRPIKHQITARVDADVLDWLKSGGKGYQGRMNAILRREMTAALVRKSG